MSKKKVGKSRLDKYYHLAKEHGYRSRAAFKLIQLDQKYNIFSECSSIVDLCAAPGGWSQVAAERGVPLVIGIDMVPMKSIAGVQGIVSDITTEGCKKELLHVFGRDKVDLFLHDGAPNVGTCWEQDAYLQNELVMHAGKLATCFLKKGGAFLTKVFRSKDYCSLLSLFDQIFATVEATKPLSSRNESAEIFVYCKGFKPECFKESLFSPSYVFKEEDGKGLSMNGIRVMTFPDLLNSRSPLKDLENFEKIEYAEQSGLEDIIDQETRILFSDLKVIGSADIKKILRKRTKVLGMIKKGKICVDGFEVSGNIKTSCKRQDVKRNAAKKTETKKSKVVHKKDSGMHKTRLPKDVFFRDRIFDIESGCTEKKETVLPVDIDQISQVDSCSDSMELNEEELLIAKNLKENEEDFVLNTIDRYCNNDMDNLPDFIKEEEKEFERRGLKEAFSNKKKDLESVLRRRRRASKKAAKIMEGAPSDEKGLRKRVFRSSFRKTRTKPRVVVSSKSGLRVHKGKGRIKLVDRRMKKDAKKTKSKQQS